MARARKSKVAEVQPNPVLDTDVDAFDFFIQHWQGVLNLRNWRIVRSHKRDPKNLASIESIEHEHHIATYQVGVDFGKSTKVTPKTLESTAIHELLHILLSELVTEAIAQGEENEVTLACEHSVILLLEKLLQDAYGIAKD